MQKHIRFGTYVQWNVSFSAYATDPNLILPEASARGQLREINLGVDGCLEELQAIDFRPHGWADQLAGHRIFFMQTPEKVIEKFIMEGHACLVTPASYAKRANLAIAHAESQIVVAKAPMTLE